MAKAWNTVSPKDAWCCPFCLTPLDETVAAARCEECGAGQRHRTMWLTASKIIDRANGDPMHIRTATHFQQTVMDELGAMS